MPPPGSEWCSLPPTAPRMTPITAPTAASPISFRPSEAASPPGEARTRKKRTKGSAKPSLRPDSRLSVWRTLLGTRREVTTAEVTTGSVGERTAARRNASAQPRSGKSAFAASASRPIVIGIAITSARAVGPQWLRSSSRSTSIPSEKRVRISASSTSSTTTSSVASTSTTPAAARPKPSATERTEAESTVPFITPERAATIASRPPNSSRPSAKLMPTLALAAQQPALDQELRQLDRIGGSALAQVVGDDPDVEGALVAGVAADAADEDVVLAGGVDRHRVAAGGGVVDDGHARGRGEQLAGLLRLQRLAGLDVDRLGVAGLDRDPDAGRADPDPVVAEDLAGLVDQLALLVGVVVPVGEAAGLGQDVEGDLVRVDLRRRHVVAADHRARLGAQLVDRPLAGAGDGLVGGDHQALDPGRVVERFQGDDHLHGRAVRVGNDPLVALEGVGVDLGDDQRHVVVHAPVAGVVHDRRAGLDHLRGPLGADRAAGRGEDEVEALDRLVADRVHAQHLAAELDRLAGRALGGQRPQLGDREPATGEQLDDRSADETRRAQHSNPVSVAGHWFARGRLSRRPWAGGRGRSGPRAGSRPRPARTPCAGR